MSDKIKDLTRKYLSNPIKSALNSFNDSLMDSPEVEEQTEAFLTLMGAVIWADGEMKVEEVDEYKNYLSAKYTEGQIKVFSEIVEDSTLVNIGESCSKLDGLNIAKKDELIQTLYAIAFSDKCCSDAEQAVIAKIADNLNMDKEHINRLQTAFVKEKELRTKVLKSGSGIAVALIIITLFVLTATFLKSVLIGLILAYLFLPLQRVIEGKILPSTIARATAKIIALPIMPFKWGATKVKSCFTKKVEAPATDQAQSDKNISCHLTVLTAIALFIAAIVIFSWLSAQKISGVGESTRVWLEQNAGTYELESLKPKLESLPGFSAAKKEISSYLMDSGNQKQLALMFIGKSGGFIASATSLLSRFSSILLDGLLALFFFSFFLQKMAEFKSSAKGWNPGEYLTESILTTNWMPKTSKETKSEAKDILNNIFDKLHIWVKGYATIVAIESIIYIIVFLILGIPYAVPLGFMAGCTVLLPFIGPLVSGLLTILVYLAVTGAASSMTIIVLILATYTIMNGVIEQLMLYPALIGEALGLNTLETIIVVLLGGLFAGLPGMIFAVPVASILKFITPKIYTCWE